MVLSFYVYINYIAVVVVDFFLIVACCCILVSPEQSKNYKKIKNLLNVIGGGQSLLQLCRYLIKKQLPILFAYLIFESG